MSWVVEVAEEFDPELDELHQDVRTEILAVARLLQQLGRPRADTLNGSRHANMKELRFSAADGEWRESPLLSIRDAKRSCWLPGTNRGVARSGSTAS